MGMEAMICSGEGAEVVLRTQVPLTWVIETLKYRGRSGGAKDFRRAFGRGVGNEEWQR
jgi:hypothetical protein